MIARILLPCVVFALLACPAVAAPPPWLALPTGTGPVDGVVEEHAWDFEDFPTGPDKSQRVFGRRWSTTLRIDGGEQWDAARVFAHVAAGLAKGGLKPVYDLGKSNPPQGTFRDVSARPARWVHYWAMAGDDIRLVALQEGPRTLRHALAKPAAVAEKFSETDGFPYLLPYAGLKLDAPGRLDRFQLDRPQDKEAVVLADGADQRVYFAGPDHSFAACQATMDEALRGAGWVTWPGVLSRGGVDARVWAHYASNGRDIWARVHCTDAGVELVVADVGVAQAAAALNEALAKQCRFTLHGVFFDTARAVLKPESESALGRLHAALAASPVVVEVSGHTDSVGQRPANQKLSEERATAVVAWLKAKGIGAARLSAKGYADTQPVADNDSDIGRARNRRVEVRNPNCRNQ